jgi:hypothetical protein
LIRDNKTNSNYLETDKILLKILPLRLYGVKGYIDTFLLLDGGATITLIAKQTARNIVARSVLIHIKLYGIGEEIDLKSEKININALGSFGKLQVKGAIIVEILTLPTQIITNETIKH